MVGVPQQRARHEEENIYWIVPTPAVNRDRSVAPKTMPATARRQDDRSTGSDIPRRSDEYGNRHVVATLWRGRCRRRRPPRAGVLLLLLASALHPDTKMMRFAHGQYKTGTALFGEKMTEQEADLAEALQGGEYVEDTFFPERQVDYDAITCRTRKCRRRIACCF